MAIQRSADSYLRVQKDLLVMVPQTVMPWNSCVFLKLTLRLETKPVANRQFIHLSSWMAGCTISVDIGRQLFHTSANSSLLN